MTRSFFNKIITVVIIAILSTGLLSSISASAYAEGASSRISEDNTTNYVKQARLETRPTPDGDIVSTFVNFNFRKSILEIVYGAGTGSTDNYNIYQSDLPIFATVTELSFINKGILDVSGIEYFPALTELVFFLNHFTSIDVSHNKELIYLRLDSTHITELDTSKNTKLETIVLPKGITSVDFSNNTALKSISANFATGLNFGSDPFGALKLPNSVNLEEFHAQDAGITAIDVSKHTNLRTLAIGGNFLTTIDLSQNTAMFYLSLNNNLLTELDVSNCPELDAFFIYNNQITVIDLSNQSKLDRIGFSGNPYIYVAFHPDMKTGVNIYFLHPRPDYEVPYFIENGIYCIDLKNILGNNIDLSVFDFSNSGAGVLFNPITGIITFPESRLNSNISFITNTGWSRDGTSPYRLAVTVKPTSLSYLVDFQDYKGESIKKEYVLSGASATPPILSSIPTPPNMIFDKWDISYSNVTSNLVVTALYKDAAPPIPQQYSVIFWDWDGVRLSEQWVLEGSSAIAPSDPMRDGYVFIGWDRSYGNVSSHLDVYALYEKIGLEEFIVQFIDWDGSLFKEEVVEKGSSATAPSNPIREGYTFIGWDKSFTNVLSNLVVNALYKENTTPPIETFTVVFKDYDGTILKTESVERGGSATAPASPIREGYTFIGWDRSFTNVTSNITVNALYTPSSSGHGDDDSIFPWWWIVIILLIMLIVYIIYRNSRKKTE